MGNEYELEMQRRNTAAYIAADPAVISLSRAPLVNDGAGGLLKGAALPVDAQTFRLINGQISQVVRRTVDGQEMTADYLLMGRWDADVVALDEFDHAGAHYKVIYVLPDPTYEKLAEVAYIGPAS